MIMRKVMTILIYDSLLPLTQSNLEMNYECHNHFFAKIKTVKFIQNNVIILFENSNYIEF